MFSRIIRNKNFSQIRLFSTLVSLNKSNEVNYVVTSKISSKKEHEKVIKAFFEKDEDLKSIKQYIPTILLNRTYDPSAIYLIDQKVATVIAYAIRNKLTIKNTKNIHILEANPGLGLLTDELIKKGFQNINLFESKVCFFNYLVDKYGHKNLNINCDDFFSIWKLAYQDRYDNGTRVADMMENFKPMPWTSGSSGLKIIGSIPNSAFIKHIIYSVILQIGLVMYGRPEMFLVMQPALYHQLTAQPEDGFSSYRALSVLFQLLFKSEILEKLPRESYLPWHYSRSKKRRCPFKQIDPDYLYLVQISGKKNLPVPINELQPLWYFVRHHMLSRSNRVIPELERWIPGCGLQFIVASNRSDEKRDKFKNIGIYTKFGELPPEQILDLFKLFISMPEYQESSFLESMETSLLKLESTEESANAVEVTDANQHEQELFDENNQSTDHEKSI